MSEALADRLEVAIADWRSLLQDDAPTRPLADELAAVVLEWQTSRKVEITDALVAQSARATYVADNYGRENPGWEWDEGHVHDHAIDRYLRLARAALGGGDHAE